MKIVLIMDDVKKRIRLIVLLYIFK